MPHPGWNLWRYAPSFVDVARDGRKPVPVQVPASAIETLRALVLPLKWPADDETAAKLNTSIAALLGPESLKQWEHWCEEEDRRIEAMEAEEREERSTRLRCMCGCGCTQTAGPGETCYCADCGHGNCPSEPAYIIGPAGAFRL